MRILVRVLGVILVAVVLGEPTVRAAGSCEGLSSLTLPETTITSAQVVAAGAFSRPQIGSSISEQAFSNPIGFCRVSATLKPSADSDIKMEVWLPLSGWNGKYQAVGNGGWAGMLNYPWMSAALGRGYATSSTDTGHVGATAAFTLGHPEKLVDFGYRSVHEMTVVPGMNHCRGGAGPDTFDAVSSMDQWIESGKSPEQIIASHSAKGIVDRTRPALSLSAGSAVQGRG